MVKQLYYSKYCVFSKEFLSLFQDCYESPYFEYISVDRNPRTHVRHPLIHQMDIKVVPTIIYNNTKLYGKDAFVWLHQQLQINGIRSTDSRTTGPVKNLQTKEKITGIDSQEAFEDSRTKTKYYEYGKDTQEGINTPDADNLINPETGQVVYSSKSLNRRQTRKGDSLKTQQEENKFHQLLKEKENFLKYKKNLS